MAASITVNYVTHKVDGMVQYDPHGSNKRSTRQMNKHTATFHGHTFTRNSESRVYSHMVVVVESIAEQRAQQEARARADWKMNHDYTVKMAKGGDYVGRFADGVLYSVPVTEDQQARAQAYLAGGVEGRVAKALADFDKRIADAWKTESGLCTVGAAGWCSRLDLAVKLASKTKGGVIVEVTRK